MQLSYAILKSVLQYLEPNLRIQLSLRSPSLKNCDKTCPLRIRVLSWTDRCLRINGSEYLTNYRSFQIRAMFASTNPVELEEFVRQKNPNYDKYNFIQLTINGGPPERVVNNKNIKEMVEYVVKKLLGGRKIIAKHTSVSRDNDILHNLMDLVTKTLAIFTQDSHKTLDTLTSIFHPSTFPLKSLQLPELDNYRHPIIQAAQLLVVGSSKSMHLIPNKRAHAWFEHENGSLICIQHWLRAGKEVGTHFSVGSFIEEQHVERSIMDLMKIFEGSVLRKSSTPTSFAIKIDNFSEITIDYEKRKKGWKMNFKVQSIN